MATIEATIAPTGDLPSMELPQRGTHVSVPHVHPGIREFSAGLKSLPRLLWWKQVAEPSIFKGVWGTT